MAARRKYRKSKRSTGWSTGKIVLYAAGAGAIAGTGYFGYQYIKNRQLMNADEESSTTIPTPSLPSGSTTNTSSGLPEPPTHLAFPLRVGDKNIYVQRMQQALMKLGGKVASLIQDSGGADGVFGNGTREALFEAGYENRYLDYLSYGGTTVSLDEYSKILSKTGALGSLDPSALAKIAVTTKQTYMVEPAILNETEARAYPVEANVVLGYLLNEQDGLSQILHESGKKYYTASSGIKAL